MQPTAMAELVANSEALMKCYDRCKKALYLGWKLEYDDQLDPDVLCTTS